MARSTTSELIMSLIDRVSGPARRVGAAVRGVNKTVKDSSGVQVAMADRIASAQLRTQDALGRARLGIVDTVATYYALSHAIGAPVRAAMQFESAMADVKKVVNFTDEADLKGFEKGLLDLTKRVPLAVDGLAEIAAAAGQAGIAKEDILEFTEAAAKVGVAFDIAAGDAGDAMAKLMTGLDMTLPEVVSLSDAMNHLSNNQASTAAEILDVVRGTGAMGKQYGFAAEEVAAFASAMIASGSQSDVSATSFMNMGRALTRGASATNRQRIAFKALGKDSEAIAKSMQEDAVGTTIDVLKAISELPKEMQASISSDLFGDEARALGPLLTNLDLVRNSLGMVADEATYAGSATKEFAARSATFENRVQLFNNSLARLKITVGNALLPVLTELMDKIEPILDSIGQWIAAHPDLTGNIIATVGALAALKGVVATLTFAGLLGKSGALALMAAGFKAVAFEAGAAAGATERLGRARALGVLGKVALRAAPLGAFVAGLGIKPANVGPNGESEDDMLARANDNLSRLTEAERTALHDAEQARAQAGLTQKSQLISTQSRIDLLKDEAAGLREYIGEIESEISNMGEGPAVDAMAAPLRDLLGAEKDKLAAVTSELASVEEQAAKTGAAVGGLDGINPTIKINMADLDSALSKMRAIRAAGGDVSLSISGGAALDGRRAKGGPITRGRTYLVGENGPEIVTASKSGYVHPNGQGPLAAGASGGGGQAPRSGKLTVTVNLGGITIHGAAGQSAEEMARTVMARIKDEIGAAMRGVMADVSMG